MKKDVAPQFDAIVIGAGVTGIGTDIRGADSIEFLSMKL
jgi:glycerol-3-phosphate dehydrogenase